MTKTTDPVDAARLALLLGELRLPAIKAGWKHVADRADKEGWPAARFLATLAEHEVAERAKRRIERHLNEAKLPPGKILESFDFNAVRMISKAQVMALAAGDGWIDQGANLLVFGPPGAGKSHVSAALGLALIENGYRVLFTRTTDLVQKLQIARRDLALEAALAKLDKYHLLILDDITYVTKDQAETSVLFELISTRYERRSILITANQVFGASRQLPLPGPCGHGANASRVCWGKIFPNQAMTLAAIDRLVHHATIFEMNVESYRRKAALTKKRGRGRPPKRTTVKSVADSDQKTDVAERQSSHQPRHQSPIRFVAGLPLRLSRHTQHRFLAARDQGLDIEGTAAIDPRIRHPYRHWILFRRLRRIGDQRW